MDPNYVFTLPSDLPVPVDDGACDHLVGMALPSIVLLSTMGREVDLSKNEGEVIVYCYPRTGTPDEPQSDAWDAVPGARGCTPQSCGFRDRYRELRELGAEVFGLSVQTTEHQRELVSRIGLPFEVLSDAGFALTDALRLPTFEFDGMRLLKRLTMVVSTGRIIKVFYPVFPPDANAEEVSGWLRARP